MMAMMMKTIVMILAKSHLDLLDLLHNGRGRLSRVGACVHRVRLDRHGGRRVVKRSGLGAGSRAVVRQHVQRAAAVRALRAVHHVGRAGVSAGGRKEGQDSGHEEHDDDEQLKHENKPRLLVAAIVRGGGARSRLVLIRDRVLKDGNIAMEMFNMLK